MVSVELVDAVDVVVLLLEVVLNVVLLVVELTVFNAKMFRLEPWMTASCARELTGSSTVPI